MPITRAGNRGGSTGESNGSTAVVGMGGTGSQIQVGALLVLSMVFDNSNTDGAPPFVNITDPRGNTWTKSTTVVNSPGSAANDGTCVMLAWTTVETAYENSDQVSLAFFTDSGMGTPRITFIRIQQIEEYRGTQRHPESPLTASQTGTGTAPSVTLSDIPEGALVVGVLGVEGPLADGFTQDSDTVGGAWESLVRRGGSNPTPTSSGTMNTVYKIVTSAGDQTWNPTLGTSRDWTIALFAFERFFALPSPPGTVNVTLTAPAPVPVFPSPPGTVNVTLVPPAGPIGVFPSPPGTVNATLVPFGADPDSPFRVGWWEPDGQWHAYWFGTATWNGTTWVPID